MSNTKRQTKPLHIENTALTLGKQDLNVENAFHTFREMKLDGVISGSMSFIKALLSKGDYSVAYHPDSTAREKKVIDAINKSLENLEDYDKKRQMSNWLQMLDYGCSLNEIVCKKEGGYFVLDTISPIHLSSVSKFEMSGGKLKTLKIASSDNDGLVVNTGNQATSINGDKVLFFRLEPDSDFPLGKSLLYGAYTAWKTKKILQEYEAIGVAKNLSGVLDVKVPSEYINKYFEDPTSNEALFVNSLISQAEMLHAGKGSYILSASDTNANGVPLFDISTVGGSGGNAQNYNVGQAIARYNSEIQLSLQTTVLSMGAEGSGSLALSNDMVNLMTLFIENIQKVLSSEFRKALRILFKLNGLSTENIPELVWEKVQPVSWDDFSKGWQRLIQSGGVTPTEDLEAFLRAHGEAPEADYTKKLNNETKADSSERVGDKQL